MLALVAGAIALWPAFVSNRVLQNPILQVAGLTITTKKDVEATGHGLPGEGTDKYNTTVPAVSMALRNSGEEPALINRVRLSIDRVWIFNGCSGGGPGYATIAYDFVLPGDLDTAGKPVVLEKQIQFKVDGKSLDFLAITAGPEAIGEAQWPLILAGAVELVQDNGESIRTEPFVLMDGEIDWIVEDAAYHVNNDPDGGFYDPECVGENMRMLEEALAAPGQKSPVISEFHDRLARLGFRATGGSPTSTTNSVPGDEASDTWIALLASLPRSTSAADVERNRATIAAETGLDVRVLDSSDFASLTPGYWVIYHPGHFADGHRALDKCREIGRTSDQSCAGRYLSHVEQHRNLVCRFADRPDAAHCSRP